MLAYFSKPYAGRLTNYVAFEAGAEADLPRGIVALLQKGDFVSLEPPKEPRVAKKETKEKEAS